MKSADRRLLRHLALAIAFKLGVLAVLWWVFVRDARVNVDSEVASAHVAAQARPAPAGPASPAGVTP
jgi:hypothetical protein